MKKINLLLIGFLTAATIISGCSMFGLDKQVDYEFQKNILDAHINKSAKQYLLDRGKNPVVPNDTIFKWMQLGLEYAGIDLAEYEKPGRTFVFLKNEAIRVLPTRTTNGVVVTTSNIPTAGMWFSFPLVSKNTDGTLKLKTDGSVDGVPVKNWSDYPKEDVRNFFLSLIAIENYGFENGTTTNSSLPTLLPSGTSATDKSLLGWYLAGTTPNLNVSGDRILNRVNSLTPGQVYGFDPESRLNFRIVSSDFSPLRYNDATNAATAGLLATNGQIHVFGALIYPWRY